MVGYRLLHKHKDDDFLKNTYVRNNTEYTGFDDIRFNLIEKMIKSIDYIIGYFIVRIIMRI